MDASQSSQMLSALMMISPLISLSSKISFVNGTVSRPFLEITRKMIQDFSGDQSFQCNLKEKEINIRTKYSRAGRFDLKLSLTQLLQVISLPCPGCWRQMRIDWDSRQDAAGRCRFSKHS